MKYFQLKRAYQINELRIPSFNGISVKGYEDFFKKGCPIDSFYEEEHIFDYLTPMYRGEQKVEAAVLADYHAWIGKEARKGHFSPLSQKLKENNCRIMSYICYTMPLSTIWIFPNPSSTILIPLGN